jgi:hypothetical protein
MKEKVSVTTQRGKGVLESVFNTPGKKPWGTVVYPQNLGTNKVYCESVNLENLKYEN